MVIDRGAIVGIVSEGDLLHRVELGTGSESMLSLRPIELESESASRKKFEGMHARDVMTQDVVTLTEDASLANVVRTLQNNHIRRVPIVQGAKLVGVVSRGDIMRALAARPEGSHGPTSKDDDMIRYQIMETLLSIPGTSPWATTVTVSNGIVELNGSIEVEAVRGSFPHRGRMHSRRCRGQRPSSRSAALLMARPRKSCANVRFSAHRVNLRQRSIHLNSSCFSRLLKKSGV